MALTIETQAVPKLILPSLDLEDYGDINKGREVLAFHQQIEDYFPVDAPYWEFTCENPYSSKEMYEDFQRGRFRTRIGRIGAFDNEMMATIVDSTVKSFINQGTFNEIPTNDIQELTKLCSVMISGFNENRLVVSVSDEKNEMILGGCMVVPGESDIPIRNLIGSELSILPTLSALHFSAETQYFGTTSENQVACYTRFFRLDDEQLPAMDENDRNVYLSRFSKEVLSGMARATQHWSEKNEQEIKFGILDTHDEEVINTLENFYGGQLIASETVPTQLVSYPNPLHWHYKMGGIAVIGFDHQKQLEKANHVDQKLGEKRPIV